MDILLIKPYWPYPYSKRDSTYNRIWPPLSLLNCAGLLEKNGFTVKILDAHAERINPEKISNYIGRFDKVFITSSSLDRWQCPSIDIVPFLRAVEHIREVTNEVYVMGYHGTVEPGKILNLTKAKAVIREEPEATLLDICRGKALLNIKGVSFKSGAKLISTPRRELLSLKILPAPAFHLLNFRKYRYEILGGDFALFEISRGCEFKCRFCNKIMYGETFRAKSKEQVFREVTLAVEKHNVKTGYFIDLDFFSNGKLVEALCDYLIEKNYRFKWACQTRPDFLNIEILKKWKKAGCSLIHLGVEAGSGKLLRAFNKEMDLDKVRKAVKLCQEVGIKTLAFFLFGLPGEIRQEREKSFKFAKELNTEFVSFHKVFPYLGSNIHQDNFKFDKEVDKFIRSAFIRYYLRFSYLWKINLWTILKGLRLFLGRLRTL